MKLSYHVFLSILKIFIHVNPYCRGGFCHAANKPPILKNRFDEIQNSFISLKPDLSVAEKMIFQFFRLNFFGNDSPYRPKNEPKNAEFFRLAG